MLNWCCLFWDRVYRFSNGGIIALIRLRGGFFDVNIILDERRLWKKRFVKVLIGSLHFEFCVCSMILYICCFRFCDGSLKTLECFKLIVFVTFELNFEVIAWENVKFWTETFKFVSTIFSLCCIIRRRSLFVRFELKILFELFIDLFIWLLRWVIYEKSWIRTNVSF